MHRSLLWNHAMNCKPQPDFILRLMALACLLFAACNAFEWTYTAETSDDAELVLAEADAHFRHKNYDKALTLYSRVLEINSNNNRPLSAHALYGRIRARLLVNTEGLSAITVFPAFFIPLESSALPLFGDYDSLELARWLQAMHLSCQDMTLLFATNNSTDGSTDNNAASLLADCAFISGAYGCLRLLDSNTNRVPGETTDSLKIERDFSITFPTNLQAAALSNALAVLQTGTNCLRQGQTYLERLFLLEPVWAAPGGTLANLHLHLTNGAANMIKTITNLEAAL